MKRRSAVALLIETSNAYARGLLDGVVRYMEEHQRWSVYLPEQGRGASPPAWLRQWHGDGVIARVENAEIAEVVRRMKVPVVDVSAARLIEEIPWVETDDRGIIELALQHLMQRGFANFAFCSDARFAWSIWRKHYFEQQTKEAEHEPHVFELSASDAAGASPDRQKKDLIRWLNALPKPVGIVTCYDILGQRILDVCRELEIDVPQQVAVIGVDNDRLLCDLCSPPLSSVIPDSRRTGYEAAKLLDRMMHGERVPGEGTLIPPLGIATRRSTDVLATDDPLVAKAMHFIREHACDGINVRDVLSAVASSRRILEYRFKKITGYTPHEAIVLQRLDRVRQLLQDSDLSISVIADRAGFEHVEYMSAAFRKKVGVSPSAYRRKVQPR